MTAAIAPDRFALSEYAREMNTFSISEREPVTVRLALAGCGVVGSALVRDLSAKREELLAGCGVEFQIVSILVHDLAKARNVDVSRALFTNDVETFLDADADVVVEAIGGINPARHIAERTLKRGKRVVTANKSLLAEHGSELVWLAERNATSIRYDAAVGGGVSIFGAIQQSLAASPTKVTAILNGTTNFVLTSLHEGHSFEHAIAQAQAAGFAEADSSRDLDGRDAADKLALVAWSAFGVAPEDGVVQRRSLLPDPGRYARLAAALDGVVRQLAECSEIDGEVVSVVEPVIVAKESAFALILHENNRADVHHAGGSCCSVFGPGAGGKPTASALLGDLLSNGPTARHGGRRIGTATDRRRCRWAVEILGAPSVLHANLPPGVIVHTDVDASRSWVVLTATRKEVEVVLDLLALNGVSAITARLDADVWS